MSNEWVYKNKARFDSPTAGGVQADVVYKGAIAKEIWYKGKRIWKRLSGFWGWAAPSSIDDYVFRDKDYYQEHYRDKAMQINTEYYSPGGLALDSSPKFFHDLFQRDLYIEPQNEHSRSTWPPVVQDTEHFSASLTGSEEKADFLTDDKAIQYTFSVARSGQVNQREINYFWQSPYGTFDVYTFQIGYPTATITTDDFILPPGRYSFANDADIKSYERRNYQGVPYYHYMPFVFVHTIGDVDKYWIAQVVSGTFSNIYYSLDENDGIISTDKPVRIRLTAELQGYFGGDTGVNTYSWYPRYQRDYRYQSITRAGQLRGRLNTEPDGSGEEYIWVVNDKRVTFEGFEGYWNIDPTLCLDPETGEYTPVTYWSKDKTYDYYLYAEAHMKYYLKHTEEETANYITVDFLNEYVHIQKYANGDDPYTRNKTLVAEMKLYYIEGFEWYGGAEPQEEENG